MEKFGERLKALRNEKDLTLMGLALETGLTTTAIYYWEIGSRVPRAEVIVTLARYFGVSADYLLGLED